MLWLSSGHHDPGQTVVASPVVDDSRSARALWVAVVGWAVALIVRFAVADRSTASDRLLSVVAAASGLVCYLFRRVRGPGRPAAARPLRHRHAHRGPEPL